MANGKLLVNFLDSKDSTFTLYPINLINTQPPFPPFLPPKIQILSIGDIHSGSKDFSKDALVGIAELLKDKKEAKDSPDVIIINGGALPYGSSLPHIPRIRGPRRWDEMLAISNDINNLRDACNITQVHLTRLFNNTDENTKVIYVMGEDDLKYKTDIATTLNYYFVYKPEILNDLCLELENEIESRIKIIEITTSSIEKIEKFFKTLNKKSVKNTEKIEKVKQEKEVENNKNKLELSKNQQEMQELIQIRQKLLSLYSQSRLFNTFDPKALKKLKQETEDNLTQTNNKIEKSKDIFTAEYKKLVTTGKKLSNDLKAIDMTLIKIKNSNLNFNIALNSKRINKFTGTIPAEAQSAKLIEEISFDYYKYVLGFAFGRKREVLLIGKNNLNSFNFSKNKLSLKTIISNNPTNTSNVLKLNSNSNMNITIGNLSRKLSFEPNLAIVGHTISNSFTIIPSYNNSKNNIAIACTGQLSDPDKTLALWNAGRKTRTTSALEKSLLFSGVSLISFDGVNFTSDVIKHDYLVNKANERLEKDKNLLPYLIDKQHKLKSKDTKNLCTLQENNLNKFRLDKDKYAIESVKMQKLIEEERAKKLLAPYKLISELKDKDLDCINLDNFSKDNKVLPISKLSVATISDIHFGSGETEIDLLKACVDDIAKNTPDILILNGDIIEGNLKNFMNVLKERKKPELIEHYESFLNQKNLSDAKIMYEMKEFLNNFINEMPIQNIDAQIEPFINIFIPAIDKIIEKNGYIIIASGNHYNKTYNENKLDEAEKLGSAIKSYIKGKSPKFSNVKIIHGSGSGAGEFSININGNDIPIMVSHNLGKNVENIVNKLRKKNSAAEISMGGHWHQYMQVNTLDNSIETTPSLTSVHENSFLESTNNTVGEIKGYVHSEYEIGNNKVLRHKSELKSNDYFNKILRTNSRSLQEEFFNNLSQIKIKST